MNNEEDSNAAWDAFERLTTDAQRASESYDPDTGETDPELPNPDDVLSIDQRRCADVLLTFGGPTVFLRYWFTVSDGELDYWNCQYCTTDTPSGHMERIEVSDAEAWLLADVYCGGIDMLVETLIG